MTTWDPQANDLFLKALELRSPGERQQYLDGACAGDAALRAEVESLLEASARAGSFLKSPAAGLPSPLGPEGSGGSGVRGTGATIDGPPITEGPGTRIGPYKLLQQIGEGGMGVVYMAEQEEPVRRKVALKLIKPGMDSRQVLARFEAERQALAMMDHVNIARVFDAGATESGRPYFVMELVHGVPITKYCDDNRLTPRERLELFVPVCQAIQHAHQKGIIHRDVKPSNVMITLYDGKPVPKVIDFGVAKATEQRLTERTLFTQYGTMVGTLEYMSPEQAEMSAVGADTRSDIYSLGVLLYELLTGSTPLSHKRLKEAGYGEILRMIKEEEPPKPSTRLSDSGEALASISAQRHMEPAKLTKLVRGELDWIVMKCLEKDRNRRYETANDFAADVQRYLKDEPVQACPPSAGYRLRKFARRNKGPVLAASIILLLLVGGIIGTTIGFVQARSAADAERAAKEAETARADETKAVLDFVENQVFATARPKGQEGGLGHDVTLRQAIESALPGVEGSFPEQPLIEARLRMTIGTSFWYLGDAKTAERQYLRARELFNAKLGPDHPDTLRSMRNLADSYTVLGRPAEALNILEETLKLTRAKLGPDHHDTLKSMHSLANSYYFLGRHAEALKLYEETLRLTKTKLGPDHPHTLASMHSIANSYRALGRHAEALKLREETLELMKAKLGPDHPDTLASMNNLASSYSALGRYAEALKLRQETLRLRKAKLGPDHPDAFVSMNNVALSYADLGRHAEALKLYEETLQLQKAKLGPDHPDTLASMNNLAISYAALGRHAEALKLNEETLRLMKAKLGPDHPDTLLSMGNLAINYAALFRHAEALKLREETLRLMKAKLGPDHPDTLKSMYNLAESLVELNRGEEAIPIIDECLKRASGKVVDPRLVPTVMDLRLRIFQKKKDAAGCLETAARWEALKRSDLASLYQAACFRAVCAGVVQEAKPPGADAKTPGANATRLAAEQADLAMSWLIKAVAAGYKDVAHMKKDQDLDALRDRQDFKKFMAGLEEKKNSP